MGVANVTIPNDNNRRYITAVQQVTTASSGNPGCVTAKTYTFSTQFTKNIDRADRAAVRQLQDLHRQRGRRDPSAYLMSSGVTPLDGVVSLDTNGALVKGILGNSKFASTILTLDPRQVKP